MLRRSYKWLIRNSDTKHAFWIIGTVSFLESCIFPVPPDIMLVPMIMANRARAWLLAGWCTLTSVLGGIVSYGIGYYFYEGFGRGLLEFYGYMEKFDSFRDNYNELGPWIVGIGGATPFPYKVITIASGMTSLDIGVFIGASILSRGVRFFAVCALLWYFGERLRGFIDRHLGKVTLASFVVIIGGFYCIKFLF
jgi:membrane protein YqaA with SNARE-associated domain